LTGADAAIFCALALHSGADDMCAVNHKRIARESGVPLSTVKTRLKRMHEHGHIGIIPGQTKPYINTFVLFRDGGAPQSLPTVSPYGYITVCTPCGELAGLVTNDRELKQFQRNVEEIFAAAHKENAAAVLPHSLTG
jgi:hypothetical protein